MHFTRVMFAVCLADILEYKRKIAGPGRRRETKIEMRRVDLIDLYSLYLGQLLHAALHLHCLCGLIAETLYKFFRIGNLLLLVAVGPHLLFQPFGTKSNEF